MTTLTLGAAARLVGLSRATLSRGIRSGALVAGRDGDWTYRIHSDDLARFVLNRQIRELNLAASDQRRDGGSDAAPRNAAALPASPKGMATVIGTALARLFRGVRQAPHAPGP